MKAIFGVALLLLTSTAGHANDGEDFFGELVLVTETALQAGGVYVGEVDGKCDEVLAEAIDKIVEETDDKKDDSGCKRIMVAYSYASERVSLPDIASGLRLRALTAADIESIHAACPAATFELLSSYEGHPVSGIFATLQVTESVLKRDIQKPDFRWMGRPATEEEKAIFGDVMDCWKMNLLRVWKESRTG